MLVLSRRVQINDWWAFTFKHPNYTQVISLKGVIWLVWFACPFLFLSSWEFQKFTLKEDHGFSGTLWLVLDYLVIFYKLLPLLLIPDDPKSSIF